jgi:signal peptidase I
MNINIQLLLFVLSLTFVVVICLDRFYFRKKREYVKPYPTLVGWAYSLFPIVFIVFVIRAFAFDQIIVPTGSLEPTIKPGELVVINMYRYGIRLPFGHHKLIKVDEPKRGDIVEFYWPVDPSRHFIKRVIGLPGDKISYVNKVLTINGKPAPQKVVGQTEDSNDGMRFWPVDIRQEDLLGVKHQIYTIGERPAKDFKNLVVPKGMYFMMGDNRDDSDDSRFWGFVPEKYIIGKGLFVWMSWDKYQKRVRWSRIGHRLH